MRPKQAIRQWISRMGTEVVWVKRRGDLCPCTEQKHAGGRYDRSWHRANPTAEDCQGRGIIDATETRLKIRAVFCPPAEVSDFDLVSTGEWNTNDQILIADPSTEIDDFDTNSDVLEVMDEVFGLVWLRRYAWQSETIFVYALARAVEDVPTVV